MFSPRIFIKIHIFVFLSIVYNVLLVYGKNKTSVSQFYKFPENTNTNNSLMEWVLMMDLLNESTGYATMNDDILHYDLIKKGDLEGKGRAAKPKTLLPTETVLYDGPSEIYGGIGLEITMPHTGRRLCMNLKKKSLEQLEWLYKDESNDDNCRFMFVAWIKPGENARRAYLVSLSPTAQNGFLPALKGNGHIDTVGALHHIAFNPIRCRKFNGDSTLPSCPADAATEVAVGRHGPRKEDKYFISIEKGEYRPNLAAIKLGDHPRFHDDYGHLASGILNDLNGDGKSDYDDVEWATVDMNIAPELVFEVVDIEYDTRGINMDARKKVSYAKTETIFNPSGVTITSTYSNTLKTTSRSTWYTGLETSLGMSFEFGAALEGIFEAKVEISVEASYDFKDEWSGSSTKTFQVEESVVVGPHSNVEVFSVLQRLDAKPIPFTAKLRGYVYCSMFDSKTRKVVRGKAPRNLIDKTLDDIDPNWRRNINVTRMMDDEFEITIYGEYVSDVVVDAYIEIRDLPPPGLQADVELEEDVEENEGTHEVEVTTEQAER